MKLSYRTALVAFMLLAFLSVQCATAQDSDDEWPQDSFDASSGDIPSVCRASVPSVLYAGNTAENVIVCRNSGEEVGSQTAFLVAGFLQPAHTYQTVLQNFSVVRQARVIEKGESVSFRYNVLPSSYLDPGDYNLVLGVYFQGGAHNQTFLSVAFNATVLVEASSTDPRTIMTYVTLVAILCGVIYGVAVKLGAFKSGTKWSGKQKSKDVRSPASPSSEGCDMSYISKEHQRYCEQLLKQSSPRSSPKSDGSKRNFRK